MSGTNLDPRGRDERLISVSPALEYSDELKWPRRVLLNFPARVGTQRGLRILEIVAVIGSKIKRSPRQRPICELIEKAGLENSILVVPPFRPRIGEKDKYFF